MNWHEMTCAERDEVMRSYLMEGEDAFKSGRAIEDCPHRSDRQEAIWWRRGWGNARLGSLLDTKH